MGGFREGSGDSAPLPEDPDAGIPDAGDAVPDPEPGAGPGPDDEPDIPEWVSAPARPRAVAELGAGAPDPAPGRLRSGRGKRPRAEGKQSKPRPVSAATRKDVEAKIRFVLEPMGRVWSMRDQTCGVTFLECEPDISRSLAGIVCDSPDLLAWFTGPAGGFMRYFDLLMAVEPVLLALFAHHVMHQRREPADPHQPQQAQAYAA